ncbi:RraA family protein [Vibrio tapetis]|uniref:Putative 4-hydroxy-4-methyl-2-oxoglutarate aldolase n=1 Tax=Vibrio tapetis subsp. tapetis TaxID=1671868 RepID=A0A2N8ZHM3_9VIBR|nr:RraA family protein [Vibrio tapetis]SON51414.1 Dimethylmenaquinone methyltransferase [Vibrio tapetis subsp. tapetis]
MPYPHNPTTDELVEAFKAISASTLGHLTSDGYLSGIRPIVTSVKLVGSVRTAKIHLPNANVLREALVQAKANEILVIECAGNTDYACWGELRTLAAQIKGLSGIVISGKVTDLHALQELRLPIFSAGVSALTTHSNAKAPYGTFDTAIEIAGNRINSGDIVLGDDDGIFILSPKQAEMLLPSCIEKEHKDKKRKKELMVKFSN